MGGENMLENGKRQIDGKSGMSKRGKDKTIMC